MENKHLHRAIFVWVNICRFLLAGVFIFSGFIKANDPYGTAYKIQDYLEAWGFQHLIPDAFPYLGAMAMGVFEFALGFYMLFGIHRRITPTLMLAVMSFMTPLTLWLAIANPISDCGCFGDAVKLTNWETFWKNIAYCRHFCVQMEKNRNRKACQRESGLAGCPLRSCIYYHIYPILHT